MNTQVVLVGLYRYLNIPTRILRPLIDKLEGVNAHTIFYKNYNPNIFKLPSPKEEEIFIDTIKQLSPQIVGISVLSPYVEIAKRLTYLIKKNSSSLVVWGGVGPTISPDVHIKETDVICVGEGERAFTELTEAVRDGKDYKKIKNLWINDGEKIIKNPMGPLIQDLDALPFSEYGNENMFFIESNKLSRQDPELIGSTLWLQTSRGCPYSCSFCVENMYHDMFKDLGKFVRRRSVDSVIKEAQWNLNKPNNKKDNILFIDEVFGSNSTWIDEFESRYKKEVGLPFFCEYHPKTLKSRVLKKLVNAGIEVINFGLQTGSDYIRNEIYERPGTNEEVLSLVNEINEYGVKIIYDLILDSDFETEETLKECITLLLKLPKPLYFNTYSLQHFPDYALTKKAIKAGYVTEEELGDWPTMMRRTTENWSFIPKLRKLKKLKTLKIQMLNNIIWMMCWNHVSDSTVKYAVFGNSLGSKITFRYLNIKSVIVWRIFGIGGFIHRYISINRLIIYPYVAIKMFFSGNWKILASKLNKRIIIPYRNYVFMKQIKKPNKIE